MDLEKYLCFFHVGVDVDEPFVDDNGNRAAGDPSKSVGKKAPIDTVEVVNAKTEDVADCSVDAEPLPSTLVPSRYSGMCCEPAVYE